MTRDYVKAGIRANTVLRRHRDAHAGGARDDSAEARRQMAPPTRGSIADPVEIACMVRFLASGDSPFVNGTSLVVDGEILASLYCGCTSSGPGPGRSRGVRHSPRNPFNCTPPTGALPASGHQ